MNIQCTKKVLDFLKKEKTEHDSSNDLYAWHSNYIIVDRKKMFVFTNNLTRMAVVFWGLKKSDFKTIDEWFPIGIYYAFKDMGIPKEYITKYLEEAPKEYNYFKTGTRSNITCMNKSMESAEYHLYEDGRLFIDDPLQIHLTYSANKYPIWEEKNADGKKVIYTPEKKMMEYLELL